MHLSTVGRRRNSMVVLEGVVLGLRKYRSSCLTKLHVVVECELVSLPAAMRRSVVLQRRGTVVGRALVVVFAAIIVELSEVDIEVVEIYELIHATERLVCRAVHGTKRRLCGSPRLAVHVGEAGRGGEERSATGWVVKFSLGGEREIEASSDGSARFSTACDFSGAR
jgi:hypothetical protein